MEQSATGYNGEAGNAIDLDPDTRSHTGAGSDGTVWFKLTLDKVFCVQQMIWYSRDGISTPYMTWTCTDTDCSHCVCGSNCVGYSDYCSYYTLTVSTEGAVSDLSPVSDCKYGDTVKLERVYGWFRIYEIVIIGKSRKLSKYRVAQKTSDYERVKE